MNSFGTFDANNVAPYGEPDVIPQGDYEAMLIRLEQYTSQTGNETFLAIYQVADGEHAGAQVFDYIPWEGDGRQLGERKLSAICHAVGNLTPGNTSDLEGHEVRITVGIKTYEGEERNVVKRVMDRSLPEPEASGQGNAPPF